MVSGAFAVAAIVASAIATVRQTALVAVAALPGRRCRPCGTRTSATVDWWVRLATTLVVGALAVLLAAVRVRREAKLQQMTAIAEAAQRALLRAMPGSIDSLGFAARYVSAAHEALVGGDLYEVVETESGSTRHRGRRTRKGAGRRPDGGDRAGGLPPGGGHRAITDHRCQDLDEVVRSVAGDEDFVTVVLAEFHEDFTVTLVNCGHPPPLLVTAADGGRLVDPVRPELPLGLGPSPDSVTFKLPDRARLLFYTDGLVETRNHEGTSSPSTAVWRPRCTRHRATLWTPCSRC